MNDVAVRLSQDLNALHVRVLSFTSAVILDVGPFSLFIAFELELKVSSPGHGLDNSEIDSARDNVVRVIELLISLELHVSILEPRPAIDVSHF